MIKRRFLITLEVKSYHSREELRSLSPRKMAVLADVESCTVVPVRRPYEGATDRVVLKDKGHNAIARKRPRSG